MPNRTIPEPWYSFFQEIDSPVEEETVLEILGGFVIAQVYGAPRTTADIDVVSINPRRSSQQLMEIACEDLADLKFDWRTGK
jgi:hypothetical protein